MQASKHEWTIMLQSYQKYCILKQIRASDHVWQLSTTHTDHNSFLFWHHERIVRLHENIGSYAFFSSTVKKCCVSFHSNQLPPMMLVSARNDIHIRKVVTVWVTVLCGKSCGCTSSLPKFFEKCIFMRTKTGLLFQLVPKSSPKKQKKSAAAKRMRHI